MGLSIERPPEHNLRINKNGKYLSSPERTGVGSIPSPMTPVTPQPRPSQSQLASRNSSSRKNKNTNTNNDRLSSHSDPYQVADVLNNNNNSNNNQRLSSSDNSDITDNHVLEQDDDDEEEDDSKYAGRFTYDDDGGNQEEEAINGLPQNPSNSSGVIIPDNVPFAIAALFDSTTDPNPISISKYQQYHHLSQQQKHPNEIIKEEEAVNIDHNDNDNDNDNDNENKTNHNQSHIISEPFSANLSKHRESENENTSNDDRDDVLPPTDDEEETLPPSMPPVLESMQSFKNDNQKISSIEDTWKRTQRHASNPEIIVPGDAGQAAKPGITIIDPIVEETTPEAMQDEKSLSPPDKALMMSNSNSNKKPPKSPSPDDRALVLNYQLDTVPKSKFVRRLSFPLGKIEEHPQLELRETASPISPIDDSPRRSNNNKLNDEINEEDIEIKPISEEQEMNDDIDDNHNINNNDNDDIDDDKMINGENKVDIDDEEPRPSVDKDSIISELEADEIDNDNKDEDVVSDDDNQQQNDRDITNDDDQNLYDDTNDHDNNNYNNNNEMEIDSRGKGGGGIVGNRDNEGLVKFCICFVVFRVKKMNGCCLIIKCQMFQWVSLL